VIREGSGRHLAEMEALRHAIMESPGVTTRAERDAAFAGTLAQPLGGYVAKIHEHSHRITDEDFDALRAAGVSEDAIFELTAAAALGAATRRLDLALRAMAGS
jgi:hypothetical protein